MGCFTEDAIDEATALESYLPPGALTFLQVSRVHKKIHAMANAPGHTRTSADEQRVRAMDHLVATMIVQGSDYLERDDTDANIFTLIEHLL